MGKKMNIENNRWYRYYDIDKNIDVKLFVRYISNDGYIHAIAGNRYIKYVFDDIKDYLYDEYGYNLKGFNEEGYDRQGFDKDGYNITSVDRYGCDQYGDKVLTSGEYIASCYAGSKTTNQFNRQRRSK